MARKVEAPLLSIQSTDQFFRLCKSLAKPCQSMNVERRYNPLKGFDFNLLDDPEFREDSVREEIIVPILKALGYGPLPPNKIIRSKRLLHPFVSIGSKTKEIHIVPDYLFEVAGRFAWVLEAKAPNEDILKSKHVEQAYSYAIHSEIRVPYFALCNGKQFVLYDISKLEPVIDFNMPTLPCYWGELEKHLSPSNVLNVDTSLKKDFGLHLKRLGFDHFSNILIPEVPITHIAKLDENQYTFSAAPQLEDDAYVATFDFNAQVMVQLYGKVPHKVFQVFSEPPFDVTKQITFADALYKVTVDCHVGKKLEENKEEIFLPLRINRIVE